MVRCFCFNTFAPMQQEWFSSWFNTPYYHILYKNRDYVEASAFLDKLTAFLNLPHKAFCWDLCCGKGRHSIYLNSKGYQVTGTDLSEQSIVEANKYASDTLEFYQHDMRKLFRVNYFDAVFNLFTSFGYFESRKEDLDVFKSVQKGLKANGLFVFDFFNACQVKQCIIPSDTKTIDSITFHIKKHLEGETVVKVIEFEAEGKLFKFEERVKLFDRAYFQSLAKDSGLTILHTFGDYQLNPFSETTSPRLILIMKK